MRALINSDRDTTRGQSSEQHRHAETAVATIWLVFYGLALGVAISSPFVYATMELASK
jgi:hypothetical protein